MRHASAAAILAGAALVALTVSAQAPKAAPASTRGSSSKTSSKNYAAPRTPWGDPDFQGTWTSDDCIGLRQDRAADLGDRAYYTEQELGQSEKRLEQQLEADNQETVASNARVGTGPPSHWAERARRPCRQTSLVVEPVNGRTPALTAAARLRPIPEGAGNNNPKADSWEDFSYYIRCITRGVTGSILPVIYGNGQQVVQAPGFVSIMQEMVHEARVIPLNGAPHASPNIRSYMGDPRGHWDGPTLVVETTNFLGMKTGIGVNGGGTPTSAALKLVERYTRTSADQLQYEVTVDDPETFQAPFTMRVPLTLEPGYQNFEYACHEGNYAMFDSLSGARAEEKKAAAAAAKKK